MGEIAVAAAKVKPKPNKKSCGYYVEVRGNRPNGGFSRMSPDAGRR